jgi:hypothetical protein
LSYPNRGVYCQIQSLEALAKVNPLRSKSQLLIALHSPYALLEIGLRMCPAEKNRDGAPFAEQSVLCSPVCVRIIAKYGHVSRIPG